MLLEDKIKSQRKKILEITARHGASNVRIFGSVARGETTAESDIDFIVDLEPGRTLLDRAALTLELEELLDCDVDVVTERGLKSRYKEKVLKEATNL